MRNEQKKLKKINGLKQLSFMSFINFNALIDPTNCRSSQMEKIKKNQ